MVVSINGTPIDADVGQKVEGCTVVVEVTGLDPDPQQVNLGVTISAVAPTVPEGSTDVLVDEDLVREPSRASSERLQMDDLVDAFAIKTNGYRLAVAVTLDGASMGARELWLACGATQDGEPNRIVFEVQWLDPAGKSLTMPLDSTMPAGWRDAYAVHASSIRGTATCTIPPGAEQLVCEYVNPGHGSEPGLVVPAGKRHTYEVAQVGLAAGWVLDESTVGTFLGRETCPTGGCGGGGGHDAGGGGHDGGSCGGQAEAVTVVEVTDVEDAETCVHTVINQRLAPSTPPVTAEPTTTTTTTSTTSTPPTTTTTTTTSTTSTPPTTTKPLVLPSEVTAATPNPTEPPTTVGVATLPRTGSGLAGLALAGLALLVVGLVVGLVVRASPGTDHASRRQTPR